MKPEKKLKQQREMRKTLKSCGARIRGEIQDDRCRDKDRQEDRLERFKAGKATVARINTCGHNEYTTEKSPQIKHFNRARIRTVFVLTINSEPF